METQIPMTMRDYLRLLFRQKAVVLTAFITVTVTVGTGLMLKTPVYEARVKMLISAAKQVEAPYYRDLVLPQNIAITMTQSEIVKSDPVLERAVKAMGLYQMPFDYEKRFSTPLKGLIIKLRAKIMDTKMSRLKPEIAQAYRFRLAVAQLRAGVNVEPLRDTSLFLIKARDFSPYGAAVIANVVSRSYAIFDLEQQLVEMQLKYGDKNQAVTQLKDNIAQMEKGLSGELLPNTEAIGPASVKIIEQAQLPMEPSGMPKGAVFLLSVFMGAFLGVLLAFVFEYMDPTFKSPREIESELNLPVLGSVPRRRKKSPHSHFYQILADQLYLLAKDKKLKTILITSPGKDEGTAEITSGLGTLLSHKANYSALLIDANFRGPSTSRIPRVDSAPGLAQTIEGKCSLKEAAKSIGNGLYSVPAGKTELNPVSLLDSNKVSEVLKDAAGSYEIVLLDCPNLQTFKDASALAARADAVVVVVSEGITRRQVLKAALQPLFERKVNILGVVLNNRTFPIPKAIYERV